MKIKFIDTVSVVYSQSKDTTDFCGDKHLLITLNGNTINNSTKSLLNVKNSDFIYFNPPADTKSFGVGLVKVVASLMGHPSILSASVSFKAITLGSIVPKIDS